MRIGSNGFRLGPHRLGLELIAIATLLVVVMVTSIVTRVGTVALTATGLSVEVAHFQARSALTAVGFTSSESELILNHPVRRRIVSNLMLIGNAGLVTMIATLVAGLASSGRTSEVLTRVAALIGGLVLILLLTRSKTVDRWLSHVISRALRKWTSLDVRDYVQLLDLASNYAVGEVGVESQSWLAEHQLSELELPDEGVLVLGIRRADGSFIGAPRGTTSIHKGDVLTVYGYADIIEELGTRRIGPEGDATHAEVTHEIAERRDSGEEPLSS